MCGGTYRKWKNRFFFYFFLLFLMRGDEFCRLLYILPLWWSLDPPSCIWNTPTHSFLPDIISYMCMISCSWRQGPYVLYISSGYFWSLRIRFYWTRWSRSGAVGSSSIRNKNLYFYYGIEVNCTSWGSWRHHSDKYLNPNIRNVPKLVLLKNA